MINRFIDQTMINLFCLFTLQGIPESVTINDEEFSPFLEYRKSLVCKYSIDRCLFNCMFTFYNFLFQSGALGNELLECVYKQLDIVETDYFGLQYTDETGLSRWIDTTKSIKKQTSKQKGKPLLCSPFIPRPCRMFIPPPPHL